ncbi:hypothetical protein CA85_47230 [Allorhodopirellula solitaria]|uniref:Uncharacterized protein n=1 Tax=Allorhodopirellula solitaria TaxID=2527987 RepID=A0A5C5X0U4_9BACT|nr:hypothetical protein CA85_47230 [Allorhodopirellula solitaria]
MLWNATDLIGLLINLDGTHPTAAPPSTAPLPLVSAGATAILPFAQIIHSVFCSGAVAGLRSFRQGSANWIEVHVRRANQ